MKVRQFSRKYLSIPYGVFMFVFIICPLVILFLYAFAENQTDGTLSFSFTMANFKEIFNETNLSLFGRSLRIGIYTTLLCLVLGYPVALILNESNFKYKGVIIMLFMLPMWVNFLIRTLATKAVFLTLDLKFGEGAVIFTMVYNYLPFMIMPIYNTMQKIDKSLFEGAQDLGASPLKVLTKITIPLSLPGVLSGATMVFMPSITTFAISKLMSNGKIWLIGDYIESETFTASNFNAASAISLIILVVIGISMLLVNKFDKDGTAQGGMMQ